MTDKTAKLFASIARREATARELIAEGFATKAAQGRAREMASRAYSDARELFREKAGWSADVDLPYETNNFRAKHSAAALAACPAAAEEVATIERTVALYAEIKAAPVAPKAAPVKLNDAGQLPLRSDAFNPVLRAQFGAQAPAITAAYVRQVRSYFEHYVKEFGADGMVPCNLYPNARRLTDAEQSKQSVVTNLIGRHCAIVGKSYVLDEKVLAEKAAAYGMRVALQWFYKTNAKLGELVDAKLVEDNGGYVVVTGAKADGSKVSMRQQRVTKWAPVSREMFSQFPSHLYVDGKFHTAREFAKRFADASADE